jgi:hypothetical protein
VENRHIDRKAAFFWRTLPERYSDESAVIFDLFNLFNEPHDPLDDDFLPIHVIGTDGDVAESGSSFVGPQEWAARLITAVPGIRPDGIILLRGVDWAFGLQRFGWTRRAYRTPRTSTPAADRKRGGMRSADRTMCPASVHRQVGRNGR